MSGYAGGRKKMDPNALWNELLIDMSVLFDMRHDEDYRRRLEWAGEDLENLQNEIAEKLENLAEWIRKGGALPVLSD
jgi:hypothetical protein